MAAMFCWEVQPRSRSSSKCLSSSSLFKHPFSNCGACLRRLSYSTSDQEEDEPVSEFEDNMQQIIVSMIRSRAMKSKIILHPTTLSGRLLFIKEENDEFSSVKTHLSSSCPSIASSNEAAFYSVNSNFSSRCPSIKDDPQEEELSAEIMDEVSSDNNTEVRRRAIIREICHCKGWPFGLCRKLVLLPPLPKSPSESWSWCKPSPPKLRL